MVTACISGEPRPGVDFLPLTIDYEERLYAAGKIPGGFIRREGRPSQEATLAARLADRPLRPLLPKMWRKDIQIVVTVLSADQLNGPDILGVIGSSAALSLSEVPFAGPVGATRVGYIDEQLALNPTLVEMENSQLDMVVVSTKDSVPMVELGAKEVSEEMVIEAIRLGHEANQGIIGIQEELRQALGKAKLEAPSASLNPEAVSAVSSSVGDRLPGALYQADRAQRQEAISALKGEIIEGLQESFTKEEIVAAFNSMVRSEIRGNILSKSQRISGRGLTDVRPLHCEVELLPRTHGSALFSRGKTQVLTITTLGSTRQEQQLDGLGIEDKKRFIHHYNFPPFSTGEVKRIGSTSRREIGHGALAERALIPILPTAEDFPYTIRLVSEVLSSNGSTSMASVCAGSLSLMDAGIPIKSAVAGIAMGLITDEDSDAHAVITDLEGLEDAYGDMDFKVAGTSEGITAAQMDTKLKGVKPQILAATLLQAKEARLHILNTMNQTIAQSRPEVSQYAPRMYKIMINPDKIGAVIGTGGKTIRSIIEETKTTIDVDNDGTVLVGSPDKEAADKAIAIIEGLTKDAEIGAVYTGKVTRTLNFGAMVEILPGKEGLVHISELANYRVPKVEDVVKVGDEITVKVIEVDNMGRINLSRRALLEDSAGEGEAPSANYPFRSQRNSRPPQRFNRNR